MAIEEEKYIKIPFKLPVRPQLTASLIFALLAASLFLAIAFGWIVSGTIRYTQLGLFFLTMSVITK